jgi:hypothetical protein
MVRLLPGSPGAPNQAYLGARLTAGFFLLVERVAHHQKYPGAVQPESDPTLLTLAVLLVEYRHGSRIEKNRSGPLK